MAQVNPKVLLTGFGPFPDVPRNASSALVIDVAKVAMVHFPDWDIQTFILPADWRDAPANMHNILHEHRPDLVLHFGVSNQTSGFEIETCARNITCQTCDATGKQPVLDCLQVGGPDELPVNLDAEAIVHRLHQHDIAAKISPDAGKYLCNAILYHSLLYAKDHKPNMLIGFIHIPDALARQEEDLQTGCRPAKQSELTWPQAVRGGVEIVASCL